MRSTAVCSLFAARPAAATSVPFLALLAFGSPEAPVSAAAPHPADTLRTTRSGAIAAPAPTPALAVLTADDSLRLEGKLTRAQQRRPLERYFARFSKDTALVRRVARAVVHQAHEEQVAASLVAAVLVTENTTLKPWAESHVGAVGLMQVMPMHAGQLGCASADLVDVDSNICHGTRILARNLRRSGSSTTALLRYNGCVRGTNTPDCHKYPGRVLARAGQVRQEMLAAAPAGLMAAAR
jgi:soluble lytic murein transglycosylase-like protein